MRRPVQVDPERWGVVTRYEDVDRKWRTPPQSTVDAVLDAMGADEDGPPASDAVLVVRAGDAAAAGDGELETEEGTTIRVRSTLPRDLAPGYHRLHHTDGRSSTRVIVSPGRCHLPSDLRAWGWALQLYAMRSDASWGMGDLADLSELARWSRRDLGAGFALVNPLHAALPVLPQQSSPYFPSSRRFRNPLYLRVQDVPGFASLEDAAALAAAGEALNELELVERDAIYRLKIDVLGRLWGGFGRGAGDAAGPDAAARFERWRAAQGEDLHRYAVFCVMVEQHGAGWRDWAHHWRTPTSSEVRWYAHAHAARVGFHEWLQWLLDEQLGEASAELAVVHDLAVGVDPAGADAWLWSDAFARGMAVGAPPDEFNTQGQNWGLPPFDPWRLRAAAYEPFVQTIRAAFRHAGGVRLDHVMGLYRLFWIPDGAPASEGTYVRYPARDLLDIVALESSRAGAFCVGEDLGTVEDAVRDDLAERNVLSYRVYWFEERPPAAYPERALAAVTTHDLPTVAGLWTGRDLQAQRDLDLEPNEESTAAIKQRLVTRLGLEETTPVAEVVARVHDDLGRAPCTLLAATLDDALAVDRRPNMPGTTDAWPNWSIPLPGPLEEIERDPGPRRIAAALRRQPSDE